MASIRKSRNGKGWRAEVAIGGVRSSGTFETKAAAAAWAAKEETSIRDGLRGKYPPRTVAEAFERYGKEVSATKAGARHEVLRLDAFVKDFPKLAAKVFHQVDASDLAVWRDARLKVVSRGSVQRDINLYRNVWTIGAREWKWCGSPSPWRDIRSPGDNPPRDQRIPVKTIQRLVRHLGYRTGVPPATKTQEVAWAFMIALRTGLRAGEIMGITRDRLDLERGVLTLTQHKTVTTSGVRKVPITKHGQRLLRGVMAGAPQAEDGRIWRLKASSLDALFRKAKDELRIKDITFHDSRAEALTRLSRRMDVMTLARISGHRDLRTLMDSYYRESAESIAART